LNIWTSKNMPKYIYNIDFDLLISFAPQLFRHLHFKKWPEPINSLRFLFANVLHPTAMCHFCKSEPAKLVYIWGLLFNFTHKYILRPNGVSFFISLLKSYLRTRHFQETTFRTFGTTNHWENTTIRDLPYIWHKYIFSF